MITLADEIMAMLPNHPLGLYVRDAAVYLGADYASIRQAYDDLEESGRAKLLKRKRGTIYIVLPDYEKGRHRICRICKTEFEWRRKSKAMTCSRSCANSYGWRNAESSAKRKAAISAAHQTPKALARTAEHNQRRWAKPGERKKLSEQNRRQWRDPVAKAKRSVSIQRANSTPEKRKFYSETRKRQWKEKEFREKTVAGIRASKNTPEAKAKFSKLLSDRWKDPDLREKYLAAARANAAKNAARNRGKPHSPEHRRKIGEGLRAHHEARSSVCGTQLGGTDVAAAIRYRTKASNQCGIGNHHADD